MAGIIDSLIDMVIMNDIFREDTVIYYYYDDLFLSNIKIFVCLSSRCATSLSAHVMSTVFALQLAFDLFMFLSVFILKAFAISRE